MKARVVCAWASVCAVCAISALSADALVLMGGRRIDGLLVGARDAVIEFEQKRPQGGRERVSIDRVGVVRIELDDARVSACWSGRAGDADVRDRTLRNLCTCGHNRLRWDRADGA